MKAIVVYRSKYGATETYAKWIAEALDCRAVEAKNITVSELQNYDTIVYGGGLYAEVINGVHLITKNLEALSQRKILIYTTGITPLECHEYYDELVVQKNFKNGIPHNVKIYNFMGKMIMEELTFVHKKALQALKKIMQAKENPTEMEKLLIELCDADGDFTEKKAIDELVREAKR